MMHLINWLLHRKWTGCRHPNAEPVGFADWRCKDCGADDRA